MELVVIISTITSFFSHLLIDKGIVANTVSVICATLVTWMLVGNHAGGIDTVLLRNIAITVVLALMVSLLVGQVFAYHKKCSK